MTKNSVSSLRKAGKWVKQKRTTGIMIQKSRHEILQGMRDGRAKEKEGHLTLKGIEGQTKSLQNI